MWEEDLPASLRRIPIFFETSMRSSQFVAREQFMPFRIFNYRRFDCKIETPSFIQMRVALRGFGRIDQIFRSGNSTVIGEHLQEDSSVVTGLGFRATVDIKHRLIELPSKVLQRGSHQGLCLVHNELNWHFGIAYFFGFE